MKLLVLVMPVALLVAYSQLIVKWRTTDAVLKLSENQSIFERLSSYLLDPFIFSGYLAALLGSFLWLLVIPKVSLSIGFPVYIGVTFLLVIFGSWFFLNESITLNQLLAVLLIFAGITIGAIK